MTRLSRIALTALAASLALSMTACGGSSGGNNQTGNNQSGGEPQLAPPAQLHVTTSEFKFDLVEAAVAAGWVELVQDNKGKQPHEVQVFRLNEGITFSHFKAAVKGPNLDKAATAVGGTAGTAGIAPGGTQTAILNLEEGSYGLVCFVQGHHVKGMIQPLEVTAPTGEEQAEPESDGTIKTADFEIFLPEGFTGQGTYEVENAGPSEHEVTLFKVNASLDEIEKYLASKNAFKAPPPGGDDSIEFAGGAAAAEPGTTQYVTLDLAPGVYVATCFVPGKHGQPHAFDGMAVAFEVT